MKIKKITKTILDEPKKYYDVINANPYNNFLIKTNTKYICSHNCFFDEISFQNHSSVEVQKEKAKLLVNTASARMQSRFMKGDKNPTLLILASSKRTEQSYMETFIQGKKDNESKTTLVIDEPQWVIREDKNTPEKFKVAVGNKFLSSEVVPLNATDKDLKIYRDRGFTLIDVPIGYYENFIDDIDIALTDIAGISTTSSSRYISGARLVTTKDESLQNPFSNDILEIGDSPDDTYQYYDFFDLNKVDKSKLDRPLFIHMDMSISGDKTGIAGVWITGKKPPEEGKPESRELLYQTAFSVSIKAPKGYQISFEKNRQFIYWLKEQGFAIKGISTDTFQSYDTGQALKSRGFNYEIVSVDRVTDRVNKPYQYFKTTIYENRIKMYDSQLLTDEILGLERNNNNGVIDHSPAGINCLIGDTKISLTDGREVEIEQLVKEYEEGKLNFVYSFNHDTHRIEPKPILKAWCSGHDASVIKVNLDNGESIICTPEHRFLLKDGSYCEAQNLNKNMSLMPLYSTHFDKRLSNNYRVVSIEALPTKYDVYDLEIADNHNFALSSGIFVHNSKDCSDAVCGAIWNASNHAEEFSFEYGEILDTIVDVSTQMTPANQKQQVMIDFEEELKKVSNEFSNSINTPKYLDFGFGPSTTNYDMYVYEGIIL